MIGFLIWLVCVLLIVAAVLGLLRAVLALPPFSGLAPYTGVVYALVVLIVVLIIVDAIYGGPNVGAWARPPRW